MGTQDIRRRRRTTEERLADLAAKAEEIRRKDAEKKSLDAKRATETYRAMRLALRNVEDASDEAQREALVAEEIRGALEEARRALIDAFQAFGVPVPTKRRSKGAEATAEEEDVA